MNSDTQYLSSPDAALIAENMRSERPAGTRVSSGIDGISAYVAVYGPFDDGKPPTAILRTREQVEAFRKYFGWGR